MSSVSPGIFIEDFERTENSDYLHGIIGRSLIVATRYDSMCTTLSTAFELRYGARCLHNSDTEFNQFVAQIESKYRTLNSSIKSYKLPVKISELLHQARKARNEIAHSLTKGLEGCIDTKVINDRFIDEVSDLLGKIVDGDIIVSILISRFNKEPILDGKSLEKYKSRIINWVVNP